MDEKSQGAQLTDEFWEATLAAELAPDPTPDPAPDLAFSAGTSEEEPAFDMAAAFTAYSAHRQTVQRRAAFFFALVVAFGATAFFATNRVGTSKARPDGRPALETEDPIAYAASLFNRVYGPPTGKSRVLKYNGLLHRDEAARAEYLHALSSPNAYVRLAACEILATSGIPLDVDQLVSMLDDQDDALPRPLNLADSEGSRRHVWEAIESQRTRTRVTAIEALFFQGYASPPLDVKAAAILPHLQDSDAQVRALALSVLGLLKTYEPGAEIERLLHEDADKNVRLQAADLLLKLRGEAGRDPIFKQIQGEKNPVAQRNLWLNLYASPRAPAFAREMLAKRVNDESARVMYATFLAKRGEPDPGQYLIPLVLAGTNADAVFRLVSYARVLGRSDLRGPILRASERIGSSCQRHVRASVVRWDLESDEPRRWREGLLLAQEIEGSGAGGVLPGVEALLKSEDAGLRRDAAALLKKWAAEK